MPAAFPSHEPSKVLIAGDTHGNTAWWLEHLLPIAQRHGVEGIVQAGDFGFWHGERGIKYLDTLQTVLEKLNIWIVFVDGNHENFDLLLTLPIRTDGFREVRPRILHAPRGQRWSWRGLRFLALGGGASIDRDYRTASTSWWPQEQITDDDVARSIAGGSTDVLISHDAPDGVNFKNLVVHQPSVLSRTALQRVVDTTSPRLVFHGHLHHSYRFHLTESNTLVIGLDRDGHNGSCVVFDIERAKSAAATSINDAVTAADSGAELPTQIAVEAHPGGSMRWAN